MTTRSCPRLSFGGGEQLPSDTNGFGDTTVKIV